MPRPEDLIQKMLDNFNGKINQEMRDRASQMNLSVYDVLIFASLVEREARIGDERPLVADVYLNRYEQGMKFDADPTVQYVMGKAGDWWPQPTGDDLQNVDSPYNTYLNTGIPPGPICNPGMASIQSVLEPGGTLISSSSSRIPRRVSTFSRHVRRTTCQPGSLSQGGGGGETEEEQPPPSDEEVPIEQSGG